jgi:stage II sporulation protein M
MRTGQKSGRRRYYARYITHYTKKNYMLLLLGGLFLAGLLGGAMLLSTVEGETASFLTKLTAGFLEKRRTQTVAENFLAAASSLTFVAAMFVCGFCAVAQPLELVAPLFRGLGYGLSIAALYNSYGTQAAGYVGLYIMPGLLVSTVALLFGCRESLRLSTKFWKNLRGADREEPGYPLRLYIARYLIIALTCTAAALLESFTYYLFANHVFLG